MGKPSRDKGARAERELVNYLLDRRIPAFRDWQNGPGHPGDVLVVMEQQPEGTSREDMKELARADGEPCEVKIRKRTLGYIYDELDKPGVKRVFVRADRRPWLVVEAL